MIVTDRRVAEYVGRKIGDKFSPPYTCLGIERDGKIVAGAVFNGYVGTSIEISAAGAIWTRKFLKLAGEYVFGQLGCIRVQFTTESEKAAVFIERLGGKREGLLRNRYGPNRNGIVIGILKEEYRYGIST